MLVEVLGPAFRIAGQNPISYTPSLKRAGSLQQESQRLQEAIFQVC